MHCLSCFQGGGSDHSPDYSQCCDVCVPVLQVCVEIGEREG